LYLTQRLGKQIEAEPHGMSNEKMPPSQQQVVSERAPLLQRVPVEDGSGVHYPHQTVCASMQHERHECGGLTQTE